MTKSIPLTQGKFAIVDDGDYEWLSQWKWFYNNGYAGRRTSKFIGKQKTIKMHSAVMNTPDGMSTDHANGNTLDNRRSNLRICNTSENAMNLRTPNDNTSGYKGVSWHKATGKWQVKIGFQKSVIYIGEYNNVTDAALAYNEAARKYFGDFARLNEV